MPNVPIPALELEPVIQQIRDAQFWFMDCPTNPEGTLRERQIKRNAEVRKACKIFVNERTAGYEKHRVEYREAVHCKCSEHVGGKSCNGIHAFGSAYEVIDVGSSGQVTNVYKGPPLESHQFNWLIKAGRGKTTTGEVWGTAKLTSSEASDRLARDVDTLRGRLAAERLPDDRVRDPS